MGPPGAAAVAAAAAASRRGALAAACGAVLRTLQAARIPGVPELGAAALRRAAPGGVALSDGEEEGAFWAAVRAAAQAATE